jgi:hypothetical protein
MQFLLFTQQSLQPVGFVDVYLEFHDIFNHVRRWVTGIWSHGI